MDGRESRYKDCLQQSKIVLVICLATIQSWRLAITQTLILALIVLKVCGGEKDLKRRLRVSRYGKEVCGMRGWQGWVGGLQKGFHPTFGLGNGRRV